MISFLTFSPPGPLPLDPRGCLLVTALRQLHAPSIVDCESTRHKYDVQHPDYEKPSVSTHSANPYAKFSPEMKSRLGLHSSPQSVPTIMLKTDPACQPPYSSHPHWHLLTSLLVLDGYGVPCSKVRLKTPSTSPLRYASARVWPCDPCTMPSLCDE